MEPQMRCIIFLAFLTIYGGEARRQTFEELVSRNHLTQKRNEIEGVYADRNQLIQSPPPACFRHLLPLVMLDRSVCIAQISQDGNSFHGWPGKCTCNSGSYSLLIHVNGTSSGMRFSIRVGNGMRDISNRMIYLEGNTCGYLILDSDELPSEQRRRCLNTLLIWNSTSSVTVNMAYMTARQS